MSDEMFEILEGVADYYSEITGRNIDVGVDSNDDIWVSSSRTNGREYFDSVPELELRLETLYQDLIVDDNVVSDPYEGL
jgi:hypothetical protein